MSEKDSSVPSQLDKFAELSRVLDCDEDEDRFKELLGKVVKHKPVEAVIWTVGFVKAGPGHVARCDRNSLYTESPTFDTPQEVYDWLARKGFTQSEDDPDIWS